MFFKSKNHQEESDAGRDKNTSGNEADIASAKIAAEAAAKAQLVITGILEPETQQPPADQPVINNNNNEKGKERMRGKTNITKMILNPSDIESSASANEAAVENIHPDANTDSRNIDGEGNNPVEHPKSTTPDTETLPGTLAKLYQSSRFTGYLTLALASFINYDAAYGSDQTSSRTNGSVPALPSQRRYAMAVSIISLILSSFLFFAYLDSITPFRKMWIALFKTGSKFELGICIFLVVWWTLAVGFQTSVDGIAGDGKEQYSLYYSTWGCCLLSYSVLERWWVQAGWSSSKAFISSWPHRSPAWILISVFSFFTLIWYVDLRQNSSSLDREEEKFIRQHFDNVALGQWQVLMTVISFTFIPSTIFVLAELFRDINSDGSIQAKSKAETIVEGICFLTITLMWIPTVMIATTSGGAASLIGNAYFFTWILVVIVFEGVVWFIHDLRKEQHQALRKKEAEYRNRQRKVLEQALALQNQARLRNWDEQQ